MNPTNERVVVHIDGAGCSVYFGTNTLTVAAAKRATGIVGASKEGESAWLTATLRTRAMLAAREKEGR